MKRRRAFIVASLLLLIFSVYKYINKEHRNIAEEKAVVVMLSKEFYASFQKDQEQFNNNYLDKTVELYGTITSLENNSVVLDAKNYTIFKDTLLQDVDINEQITIKGRYVGYDDLLDQLKIDQAIIVKD